MKPRRCLVTASLVVLLACLISSPALAQDADDSDVGGIWFVFPIFSTVGYVLAPSTIVTTLVIERWAARDMPDYLRRNAVALARDIALGAGPTLADLAARLHRGDTRRFARAMRQQRKPLLALLARGDELDDAGAAQFLRLARQVGMRN